MSGYGTDFVDVKFNQLDQLRKLTEIKDEMKALNRKADKQIALLERLVTALEGRQDDGR